MSQLGRERIAVLRRVDADGGLGGRARTAGGVTRQSAVTGRVAV
jgi:hypothetical protein